MSKHDLQRVLEDIGYDCSSYSGRGMYGAECLGATVPAGQLGCLFADLLEGVDGSKAGSITEAFRNMRTDAMGYDMVVFFPSVPYTAPPVEDEDDQHGCNDPSCCSR